jgi:hypothetical protein
VCPSPNGKPATTLAKNSFIVIYQGRDTDQ